MYKWATLNRLVLGGMTIAIAAGLAGCSEPEEVHEEVIRPVKLFEVVDTGMQNLREFPATVIASEEAEVSFRIPGELVELSVKRAEEVKEGQLLAQLDDRDIKNEQARTKNDLHQAQIDFNRIKSLKSKKMVSQSEYDNAKTRLDAAGIAVQQSQNTLEDTVLTAPFSGRVAETLVENHQFVQAQQTILVLQGSNELDVSIQVPESIVKQVQAEQVDMQYQPTITFSGKSNKSYSVSYKEHSTQVTPGTQSYQVWFTLPVPEDLTVYPGMGATLALDLSKIIHNGNSISQYVVPVTAVMIDDASNTQEVWKYDAQTGEVNPVAVNVGHVTQSGITVLSGLNQGDQIVAAGVNRLTKGMQVKPLERERGL